MWKFNKTKTVVSIPDPPTANHVELPPPACMQFDSDEISDFGTQVVMLMEMKPQDWAVHPNFRSFRHPQLGVFQFDGNERLRHLGDDNYGPGSLRPPGKQRALTRGDQTAIVESLRAMLLKPMDLEEPERSAANQPNLSAQQYAQQMQQTQQMQQMRNLQGGLLQNPALIDEMAQMRKELFRDMIRNDDINDAFKYAFNPLSPVHAPNTLPSVLSPKLKS